MIIFYIVQHTEEKKYFTEKNSPEQKVQVGFSDHPSSVYKLFTISTSSLKPQGQI